MPGERDPWDIMRADELATPTSERSERGAWYTPRAVAQQITAQAFACRTHELPRTVVDPTCGGGAFLLTALDEFVAAGVAPDDALGRVAGLDISAAAVDTARRVLARWAEQHGVGPRPDRVLVGDALGPWPSSWAAPDLVLGNPPFASPLRSAAGSEGLPATAEAFRHRHRAELGPYADLAAIHLLNAAHRVEGSTGRIALVVPQSVLAGRDAAPLRAWLDDRYPLTGLWITDRKVFDASVMVCAPVLDGRAPRHGASWAAMAAETMGVPDPGIGSMSDGSVVLGSMVEATAGFRDEYYGLAQACVEGSADDDRCRLATVGSIDALESFWGDRPTRFAKQTWTHPVVDEAALPASLVAWYERQRRPKVLVPTQARTLEPFVDRTGRFVPVTPLLSVSAAPDDLDHVAALLLAPSVMAWALHRTFGSALSVRAVKLRARDILEIPLPTHRAAWDAAAELVARGPVAVGRIGQLMNEAIAADIALLDWWNERRGPTRRIG